MNGLLLFLHLSAVVAWVGGMFFATLCLHPSLAVLQGKDRVALMSGTLGRFFGYVCGAIALIWASGAGLLMQAGAQPMPLGWHLMIGLGFVMTLIFLYLYLVLFRSMRAAVAAGEMAAVPSLMQRMRVLVITNLILGTAAIAAVTLLG